VASERTASANGIAAALRTAVKWVRSKTRCGKPTAPDAIVIAGSLFLAGEALQHLLAGRKRATPNERFSPR